MNDYLLTVKDVGVIVLTTVIAVILGKLVMKIVWFRQTLTKIAFGFGMSLFGFMVARLHLHLFNSLYLWLGSKEVILKKGSDAAGEKM